MIKLAFRGILRYRNRTIITSLVIAIAVLFSISMHTLITGVKLDSEKNLIYNDTSSAKIYAKGYFKDRDYLPIDYLISKEEGNKIESILEQNNYNDYTKEFVSSADIMFYENPYPISGSLTVTLKALDSNNLDAYNFSDAKIKGEWIDKNKEGVVIGAKLADDIKAEVGYYLTVQTKGKGGFIQAFDIPITGIITTGDPIVDSSTLFFDLETIDYFLELEGSSTSYSVSYSTNVAKIKSISKEETNKLNNIIKPIGLEAYAWDEIAEDVIKFQNADTGFGYIFLAFTFIIAIVGITNTMLMSISERKNEIAMMKTLGYTTKYIQLLFSIEGLFLGIIGTVIGSIIGLAISFYYQKNGIDFSIFMNDTATIGYRINAIMHAYIYISHIIIIMIFSILVSMFSAFFAVKRISKYEIMKLFRDI